MLVRNMAAQIKRFFRREAATNDFRDPRRYVATSPLSRFCAYTCIVRCRLNFRRPRKLAIIACRTAQSRRYCTFQTSTSTSRLKFCRLSRTARLTALQGHPHTLRLSAGRVTACSPRLMRRVDGLSLASLLSPRAVWLGTCSARFPVPGLPRQSADRDVVESGSWLEGSPRTLCCVGLTPRASSRRGGHGFFNLCIRHFEARDIRRAGKCIDTTC